MVKNHVNEETEKAWRKLSGLLVGNWTTQTISAAVKLGVIEALFNSPMNEAQVAQVCKLDPEGTKRLLRALIGLKIVDITDDHKFTLTPMGELLTKDHEWSLASSSILWAEEHYIAWQGLPDVIRTGKSSFEQIYGKSFFDWLASYPDKRQIYHDSMNCYAHHDYQFIPQLYDFSQHQIIMDVGGGTGGLLKFILEAFPNLKGILFELPEVHSIARELLSNSDLKDRYKVVSGNFFEELPQSSDLILLSRVLHDWNDHQASTILQRCYEALPDQGKLLVIELLLPSDIKSSFGALLNLNMLVVTGGRERTEEDYKQLLSDAGFTFVEIIPTPTVSSIIVAEKV
ncbi:MAG: methyltransferase [Candidatus Hermodarchaeota archaeon]